MQIGKGIGSNFQSYKDFEFDYTNLGLALIEGPTKAGKSTALDFVPWVLYGITSKDSAADDIKSWFGEGITKGELEVTLSNNELITVTRIRGKATQNDLYWVENGEIVRGKDIKDTQKLLEKKLGCSVDLFLTASYVHQFSTSDSFFIASAKERREILEKIADLTMPIKLGEKTSEERKLVKKQLEQANELAAKQKGNFESVCKSLESLQDSLRVWDTHKENKLAQLKEKSNNFEVEQQDIMDGLVAKLTELDKIIVEPETFEARRQQIKQQVQALDSIKKQVKLEQKQLMQLETNLSMLIKEHTKLIKLDGAQCPTCMSPIDNNNRGKHINELANAIEDFESQAGKKKSEVANLEKALEVSDKLDEAYENIQSEQAENTVLIGKFEELRLKAIAMKAQKNYYNEQLKEVEVQVNPFIEQVSQHKDTIDIINSKILLSDKTIMELEKRLSGINWLYDKSFELRGIKLEQAIRTINTNTNRYLERYFDADLRVNLTLKDADKLEVEIQNEGYPCPFKQLSGGERCMLKVCFMLSYMQQAEDASGISLPLKMLDEALNGLDATLKTKAFNLLQDLENKSSTVLLIDHHEEFKNLFDTRFIVSKSGNCSSIQRV